jgi:hypothetical protein
MFDPDFRPHRIHLLYALGPPRYLPSCPPDPLTVFFSAFGRLNSEDQEKFLGVASLSLENGPPPEFDHEHTAELAAQVHALQERCRRMIRGGFLGEEAFTPFLTSAMLGWGSRQVMSPGFKPVRFPWRRPVQRDSLGDRCTVVLPSRRGTR